MDIRLLLPPLAFFALTGCVTPGAPSDCGESPCAAFGEPFAAGSATITPLELLEDSRCPVNARCVQAGTLRIRAAIERGERSRDVELELGNATQALSGTIELDRVLPDRVAEDPAIEHEAYRFHFRWTPILLDAAR